MSNNIDERVVEMRFDNKHFEDNVKETMSTLDKFKEKLDFTGAGKGLDNIGNAANKVNMTPLANAAETVRLKFSALEVMAVTALQNITNSAINAGKRIVSALTIEPVKTGFSEYELKMNSIQTIMAGTGEDLETVNRYLNELNEYSDKTIYSFANMTQNIGKFTNAGVKLEDAVLAIKGVSNEAAVSGANANEAARAMYNFAQALSAGYVKLIDWKSIENANMATVEFKNELIKTGLALGTVTDAGDGLYKTLSGNTFNATTRFNEVLQDQWMTSDVLIETLKKYADETTGIGKKATEAATKVKTFTMLLDTLKEAAQSGWAQTWEIIVGDFEEARTLFTKISDVIGGIIGKAADARNNFLKGALGSSWDALKEKITGLGINYDDFLEKLKTTAKEHGFAIDEMIEHEGSFEKTLKHGWLTADVLTDAIGKYTKEVGATIDETNALNESLLEFGDVVNQVIVGNFGNGEERIRLLTDAGYDYATIQDLVNHVLGATTDELKKKTEEELKSLGLTEDQIKALRSLADEAEQSGTEISDLISKLSRPSGRELLIDTLKNAWKGLSQAIGAVRDAWRETFPAMTPDSLYGIIEAVNKLSKCFVQSEEDVSKLKRTFKGLFAVLDIIKTITGGALKVAFKVLATVLGMVDMPVLDVTAHVGDLITKFRDWLFQNTLITDGLNVLIDFLADTIKGTVEWLKSLRALPKTQKILENFKEYFSKALYGFRDILVKCGKAIWNFGKNIVDSVKKVKDWFSTWRALPETQTKLDKFKAAFTKAFTVISTAIQNGVGKIKELGQKFVDGVKKVKAWIDEFMKISGVQESLEKFKAGASNVLTEIKNSFAASQESFNEFVNKIKSLDKITFKDILAALKNLKNKVAQHFSKVGGSFGLVTEALGELGKEVKIKLGETWKGFDEFLDKIVYFAKSVRDRIGNIDLGGIILAALGIGTLTIGSKIGDALDALTAPLAGFGELLKGLAFQTKQVSGLLKAAKLAVLAGSFTALAAGIILLAGAVALLTLVDQKKLWSAVLAMGVLGGVLAALAWVMSTINKGVQNITANTTAILALTGSVLILVVALKLLDTIKPDRILANVLALGAIMGALFGVALLLSTKSPTLFSGSAALIAFATAVLLLVGALKSIAKINDNNIMESVVALVSIMAGLALVTKMGKGIDKWGAISALAAAIALKVLVGVIEDYSNMNMGTVLSALLTLLPVMVAMVAIMKATNLAGKHAAKAGVAILAISASLIFIATAIRQLSKISPGSLLAPLATITALMAVIAGVVAVSKFAGKHAVKAGVMLLMMAGALAIVSLITVILSKMDPSGLARGTAAIAALMVCFAGLIFITKYAKALKGVQGVLITFTVAITLLGVALAVLSSMDAENVLASTVAMVSVMGMLVVLMKTVGTLKNLGKKALPTIALLTAVVAALGGILYLLGDLDPESSLATAASLSMLLLALAASCTILKTTKTINTAALANVAILTLILGALGGILYLLRDLDPESTIATAIGLSAMILALSGACAILSVAGAAAGPALVGVGVLAALIVALGALMAGIGALVTEYPQINEWLDNAIVIFEKLGYGLGALIGGIVGGLSAGVMSGLPKIADTLSSFMTKMESFFKSVEKVSPEILTRAKTIAEVVSTMAEATINNAFSSMFGTDVNYIVSQLNALGDGILAFSDKITGANGGKGISQESLTAAKTAASVLVEISSMIPNLGGVVGFFTGSLDKMKLFAEQIPLVADAIVSFSDKVTGEDGGSKINQQSVEAAKTAGGVLVELANMIPNLGGVVGFFTGSIDKMKLFAEQMPLVADAIVSFSDKVTGANGGSKVNKESVEAAKYVGGLMAELATMIPDLGGVFGFFTGSTDKLKLFAEQMPLVADTIVSFSDKVTGEDGGSKVNKESVEAAKYVGGLMSELATMIPNLGGVSAFFSGSLDKMKLFAEQMPMLADGIVSFSDKVTGANGGSKLNIEAVKAAKSAGEVLVELAGVIPSLGGISGFFSGSCDKMKLFGEQMPILADGIVAFSSKVSGKVDAKAVEAAANAGALMATLSTNVTESTGNWLYNLFGGNNNKFKNFKTQMPLLGEAIVAFSNSISGKINAGAVTAAKTVSEVLAVLMEHMSAADIQQVSNFNTNVDKLGNAILNFYDDLISINLNTLRNTMSTLNSMVDDLVRWTTSLNTTKLNTFGSSLATAGNKIKQFYKDLIDIKISKFRDALDVVDELVHLTMDMTEVDTSGVNAFGASLTSLGATGVTRFVSAFSDAAPKIKGAANGMMTTFCQEASAKTTLVVQTFKQIIDTTIESALENRYADFKLVGSSLITGFTDGITSGTKTAKTAATKLADEVISALRNKYSSSESAGKYLVDGFASGIRSKANSAAAEARRVARAAAQAIEDELDINSPSKVLYEDGKFSGMGFVNALSDYADKSYDAGANLADSAKMGLNKAIAKVVDILDGDIDTEPTIRPVLDLTNVEAGARRLNTMFARNQVMSIDVGNRHRFEEDQNGDGVHGKSGNTYQFTQNNYSPKALSRIDIYRQTKNQFSAMERMVEDHD
jgi:hypothetical protein